MGPHAHGMVAISAYLFVRARVVVDKHQYLTGVISPPVLHLLTM